MQVDRCLKLKQNHSTRSVSFRNAIRAAVSIPMGARGLNQMANKIEKETEIILRLVIVCLLLLLYGRVCNSQVWLNQATPTEPIASERLTKSRVELLAQSNRECN